MVGNGTLLSGPSLQYMKTYCEKAFEAVSEVGYDDVNNSGSAHIEDPSCQERAKTPGNNLFFPPRMSARFLSCFIATPGGTAAEEIDLQHLAGEVDLDRCDVQVGEDVHGKRVLHRVCSGRARAHR